jgi:hypothetical protein
MKKLNQFGNWIKSLFTKEKSLLTTPKKRGFTKQGMQIYSFNAKDGEVRCETGIFYIEAPNMRRAQRLFKKHIEKATNRKVTVTKQ